MIKPNFKLLKKQVKNEIEGAKDLSELNGIFQKYLGKKGELTRLFCSLEKLSKEKRIEIGKKTNEFKNFLKAKLDQKTTELKRGIRKSAKETEWIDITAPGKKIEVGHLHPLTQVERKIEEIFERMGFSIVEGPEIETEWYNFDALNIPRDHPARDLWDTFWLRNGRLKLLLRTHTSPVQVRYMEKNQPPLRIIAPGRVFRRESTDAGHEINFYHVEGLMVDKDVSIANFKAIIEEFFKKFLGEEAKIRLRPGFFPFTEPSFEIDVSCFLCQQKGCSICKNSGWVEIMGAGMVHPNVFKNSGLNPKEWQGFAFGIGVDRLAMLKYKITDIRLFYSGDLRFLKQF